jgi:hypothetical protein
MNKEQEEKLEEAINKMQGYVRCQGYNKDCEDTCDHKKYHLHDDGCIGSCDDSGSGDNLIDCV